MEDDASYDFHIIKMITMGQPSVICHVIEVADKGRLTC